jgi:hypothetical protein
MKHFEEKTEIREYPCIAIDNYLLTLETRCMLLVCVHTISTGMWIEYVSGWFSTGLLQNTLKCSHQFLEMTYILVTGHSNSTWHSWRGRREGVRDSVTKWHKGKGHFLALFLHLSQSYQTFFFIKQRFFRFFVVKLECLKTEENNAFTKKRPSLVAKFGKTKKSSFYRIDSRMSVFNGY